MYYSIGVDGDFSFLNVICGRWRYGVGLDILEDDIHNRNRQGVQYMWGMYIYRRRHKAKEYEKGVQVLRTSGYHKSQI